MKSIKTKINLEQKKLARLKAQNEKLKASNIRLRKQNKNLEKKNLILRKQIRRNQRVKRKAVQKEQKESKITYRYSIAYFNANYDKTFRAEVYTNEKQNNINIERKLDNFLRHRVSQLNKGLQKMFISASFVGIESEEVGSNDLGRSELNRLHFNID